MKSMINLMNNDRLCNHRYSHTIKYRISPLYIDHYYPTLPLTLASRFLGSLLPVIHISVIVIDISCVGEEKNECMKYVRDDIKVEIY